MEVPLSRSRESHFFNATALGKLKDEKDQPLRVYDPGYMNTICCVLIESYWQRPPRSPTSMEIEESSSTEESPSSNWQNHQPLRKWHTSLSTVSCQQSNNSQSGTIESWTTHSFTLTLRLWWVHSDMMPIPWECLFQHCQPFLHSTLKPTLHFQDKMSTSLRKCVTNKSTDCWESCLPSQPTVTVTESEETTTFPKRVYHMWRTSSTCWTD